MRILRSGRANKYRCTCPSCDCEFEFFDNEATVTFGPTGERYVRCPECSAYIRDEHFIEEKR